MIEAIVVGAGPAGLAVAASLGRRGVPHVVIERESTVGSAWRRHYDRLHLHTAKSHSALPYLSFPESVPTYPSRLQVVEYLDRYARDFAIRPLLGQTVTRIRREEARWHVETSSEHHEATCVVLATGLTRVPHLPTWPGLESFHGHMLHSSQYRNGAPWRGRRVLVVGIGNSGAEIGIDLHEHGALPTFAVRSAVNVVPRDFLGTPSQLTALRLHRLPAPLRDAFGRLIARIAFGDLRRLGLRTGGDGPATRLEREGRVPVIDVGTIGLIRAGAIRVVPGIARFEPDGVVFTDGSREAFDAVVLATGYRPRLDDFLEGTNGVLDAHGWPPGIESSSLPGLYFLGLRPSPIGMLHQISLDARRIADRIASVVR